MILILPIFFPENESHLNTQGGVQLVHNLLTMTSEVQADEVVVYSDSTETLALVEGQATRTVHVPTTDLADTVLPPGMDFALNHAATNWPDQTITAVDIRNRGITPRTIERALDTLGSEKKCIVSMSTPLDHPCQFKRFFRYIDTQIAGLPAQTSSSYHESKDMIPTRSFAFDWKQTPNPKTNDGTETVWIRESDTHASIMYTAAGETPEAYLWNDSTIIERVIQDDDGTVAFDVGAYTAPLRVFIYPLADERIGENTPPVLAIDTEGEERVTFSADDEPGFVFQVFCDVVEGEYDFEEAAIPHDAPWSTDELGRIIDRASNELIPGRQHFPPIHHADASLVCASQGAGSVIEKIGNNSFAPFFLHQAEQLFVRSELDLLLLKHSGGVA